MQDKDLWNKIFIEGVQRLFLCDKDFKKTILDSYPEILSEIIFILNRSTQYEIIKSFYDLDKESLKGEFWKSYISKSISSLEKITSTEDTMWLWLIYKIKEEVYLEEVNWFDVVSILSSNLSAGTLSDEIIFIKILDELTAKNKQNLKKLLYKTETKKYGQELKRNLYGKAIKFGLLDKKLARRIRSDSSGSLSKYLLTKVFMHRKAYSDDDFKELITLFSDTKHKWVAQFISMNMPKDLIPFLMGIADPVAHKILEKRLNN